MKILLVAATEFEILPVLEFLNANAKKEGEDFVLDENRIQILITGVGIPYTIYSMMKIYAQKDFNLSIQAGIAGTFDTEIKLGSVVEVTEDRFADLGVEEADGGFTSLFDLGLVEPNKTPFSNETLINARTKKFDFLPKVKGITVNKVSGCANSINRIKGKYPDTQIESMEGAAFHFVNLMEQKNFIQIRAISNVVEPRNKENWEIGLAINNLNSVLKNMLKH